MTKDKLIDENPCTASLVCARVTAAFVLDRVGSWVRILDGEEFLASFGVADTGGVLFTNRRVIVAAGFLPEPDPKGRGQVWSIPYESVTHWRVRFGYGKQPSQLAMFNGDTVLLDVSFDSESAGEVQALIQEHIVR